MKLKISLQTEPKHSDMVGCLGWANAYVLYTISDDHQILAWDFHTGETNQVVALPKDTYATDIHWLPSASHKQGSHLETFVLACTDGKFLLVSRSGRVEKTVDAHRGAVMGTRWSKDGTAMLTWGEDGSIKIWSRSGMLRTTLVQTGSPIYSAEWSPDCESVIFTSGKTIVIKPLQSGLKPLKWPAHEGLVLCVAWSPAKNFIVSGGEDRKYKLWDTYGRNLFNSYLHDSPISALSWAPDGEVFVVGAFNTLRLCDKKGWSHSLEKPSTGSIFKIAWTPDGTQFAGACGNGQVLFAQIVDRYLEWNNLEVIVNANNSIDIMNVANDAKEHMDFNARIVKVSLGWGHLIVATAEQCYIYNSRNWTTPVTIDLKNTIAIIKQTEKQFLIADEITGVMVVSYEGRVLSNIKSSGQCFSFLNSQTISISPDTVAICGSKDEKSVFCYDVTTGKEISEQPLQHQNDITSVGLSQAGPAHERLLAILDKNDDLFLTPVRGRTSFKTVALGSMVTSMCWNDMVNMLAAMQDNKFVVWFHPAVIYTDKDLLPRTQYTREGSEFSKSPQLMTFTGRHCSLRRSDGALVSTSLPPFPILLHNHATAGKWEAAISLCRFVKDPALWACLAGMAISARDLKTAEIAYAAINEVDKVYYFTFLQSITSAERKKAEMALFLRHSDEAETIYLQANMIYRAIELNMTLFRWERALELAVKHKTHVDTVLGFRKRYLEKINSQEGLQEFRQYSGKLKIDWKRIKAKIEMEETGRVIEDSPPASALVPAPEDNFPLTDTGPVVDPIIGEVGGRADSIQADILKDIRAGSIQPDVLMDNRAGSIQAEATRGSRGSIQAEATRGSRGSIQAETTRGSRGSIQANATTGSRAGSIQAEATRGSRGSIQANATTGSRAGSIQAEATRSSRGSIQANATTGSRAGSIQAGANTGVGTGAETGEGDDAGKTGADPLGADDFF